MIFNSLCLYLCWTLWVISFSPCPASVLAMRGASSHPQGEPQGESDSVLGTEPCYRFTRQPVKYHRHTNPATQSPKSFHTTRQPEAPDSRSHPESANSSRSSSPEPRTPDPDLHSESSCQPHQTSGASESKADTHLSPREVVQYMLGLDSTSESAKTVTSPASVQESASAGNHADLNINHSNNRGQSQLLCQSSRTLPNEHKLTSPAHKILSGLKLRRSHSGKDEQLFVWETE